MRKHVSLWKVFYQSQIAWILWKQCDNICSYIHTLGTGLQDAKVCIRLNLWFYIVYTLETAMIFFIHKQVNENKRCSDFSSNFSISRYRCPHASPWFGLFIQIRYKLPSRVTYFSVTFDPIQAVINNIHSIYSASV